MLPFLLPLWPASLTPSSPAWVVSRLRDRGPHTHRHTFLRPLPTWPALLSHPGRGRAPGVCYPSPGTPSSPGGFGERYWLDGFESEQAPRVGDGQGGLACCRPWGCKESAELNWADSEKDPEAVRVALQWALTATWCDCWNSVLCSLLDASALFQIFFFKYFYIFIYLAVLGLGCSMWGLVPWPETEETETDSDLHGIYPTQGWNPGPPLCRRILHQLSHQGSPGMLEWAACPFSGGSSWPRSWTGVSCIAGGFFTSGATREARFNLWFQN